MSNERNLTKYVLLSSCDGVLHPRREQLLPDAEERRGHGGPAQDRLLRTRW